LTWAPVIEAQIGRGLAIAVQLRLVDRLDELPVGERLLCNALRYLASAPVPGAQRAEVAAQLLDAWPGRLAEGEVDELDEGRLPSGNVVLISGVQVPSLSAKTCRAYLEDGHTIVVWNLHPSAIDYWQSVTGRAITLFEPEHDVYQLVRTTPSPLLRGISNEDTCWLENWQYRRDRTKERIVERLAVVDGGTSLLENATRSALDVLFGDERASEVDRMPTVSAYLNQAPPRVGGGLVQLAVGGGQVLICQIRWCPDKWQFRRLLGMLLWNLGVAAGSDVLAGEHTPVSGKHSDGMPERMRVVRGIDRETLEELLQSSGRQVEYCSDNATFRLWPGWADVDTPGGRIAATDVEGSGKIYLGMGVHSPEPRKLVETVGGLPNPDLQTFLRLAGSGVVRAWVNGKLWGEAAVSQKRPDEIADIDLEAGANILLLEWAPGSLTASLGLRFENKDRQPEITFRFA
jgi:hypothetical protein